jgi:hypothetical protein
MTAEILRAARGLIDAREAWFGGTDALPPAGQPRHCALMAVQAVAHGIGRRESSDALARVMGVEFGFKIPEFNNSRTHAEVLAAFDTAIADAEAREQEFNVAPITATITEEEKSWA